MVKQGRGGGTPAEADAGPGAAQATELGQRRVGILASAVRGCPNMRMLLLSNAGLGTRGGILFTAALVAECTGPTPCNLVHLDLSHNQCGASCGTSFGLLICQNNVKIDRSSLDLSSQVFSQAGLSRNQLPFLEHLNLGYNSLGSGGLHVLFAAINNKTLRTLILRSNDLGDSDLGNALFFLITHNPTLEKLDLAWNNLSDDTGFEVAKALRKNVALLRLDLSGNNFGVKTGRAFAETLENDTCSLQHLVLANNGRGLRESGLDLARALRSNATLKTLDLDGIRMPSEVALEFAETFTVNRTLENLCLFGSTSTRQIRMGIASALVTRPSATW